MAFFGCGSGCWLGVYKGHIRQGSAVIASFKTIGLEEYVRLFEQAMSDHHEAVHLSKAIELDSRNELALDRTSS
jgi:hypothetical protein